MTNRNGNGASSSTGGPIPISIPPPPPPLSEGGGFSANTPGRKRLRLAGLGPELWNDDPALPESERAPEPPLDLPIVNGQRWTDYAKPQPEDSPGVVQYRRQLAEFIEHTHQRGRDVLYQADLELRVRNLRIEQEARQIVAEGSTNDEWPETDLADVFARGIELPVPGVLARTDGRCLLYRGLPNVIFGDASAGKTSLAIATAAEEIRQGRHVYAVDYETNVNVWVSRLLALGLTPDEIVARLHYLNVHGGGRPPKTVNPDASLTVIDSMTSALDALGAEPNDTTGIESVYRQVIDPFTDAGVAVLLIDHVGHADKSRPMNSIRKTGRVQGAMYRMSVVPQRPFGRGRTGEAVLELHKDNMGGVELPKGAEAGRFVMESTDGGTNVRCRVEAPGATTSPSSVPVVNLATASAQVEADKATRRALILEVLDRLGPSSAKQLATECHDIGQQRGEDALKVSRITYERQIADIEKEDAPQVLRRVNQKLVRA